MSADAPVSAETTPVESSSREADEASATTDGSDRATTFASIARYVAKKLPRGGRAELRRLRGRFREMPPEAFWRLVEKYDIPPSDEEFWMAVLPLMVEHPHEPRRWPGGVLRRSGVSSARLERWLRLDKKGALAEARRLLSQVDKPFDWVQFGFLLYDWDHPDYGERHRRRLARDYFLAPESRESSSQSQGGT